MVLLANHLNQSKEIQQVYTQYADLFRYLSRMSGWNITTVYDVFRLNDIFNVERVQNKTFVYNRTHIIRAMRYIIFIYSLGYQNGWMKPY